MNYTDDTNGTDPKQAPNPRRDPAEIKTDIRKAMRRFFNKRLERKPVIIPVLLEL